MTPVKSITHYSLNLVFGARIGCLLRVIGKKNQIVICYEFITEKRELFEILIDEGVIQKEQVFRAFDFNEEHLKINYFDWNFKKSKQSFNSAEELADYIKEIDFKFEDNTSFNP